MQRGMAPDSASRARTYTPSTEKTPRSYDDDPSCIPSECMRWKQKHGNQLHNRIHPDKGKRRWAQTEVWKSPPSPQRIDKSKSSGNCPTLAPVHCQEQGVFHLMPTRDDLCRLSRVQYRSQSGSLAFDPAYNILQDPALLGQRSKRKKGRNEAI